LVGTSGGAALLINAQFGGNALRNSPRRGNEMREPQYAHLRMNGETRTEVASSLNRVYNWVVSV